MGNDHTRQGINALSFFNDTDAKTLFAKLDYALREGVHIQHHASQIELFHFLQKHEQSLKNFYKEYYNIIMESGGESVNKFYYIDFYPQSRGNIAAEHRYFLPNDYVIVGFLLYKVIFIDGHFELCSVNKFQKIILQEYEDLKPGIYKTLAKAKRLRQMEMNDEKVDKTIVDALAEFNKLGWILLEGDNFETLPAFQRLLKLYSDYINNLDIWLTEE